MTELDLEAIKARADAATEGPWHGEHDEYGCVQQGNYGWVTPGPGPEYDVDSEQGKADAEFVAHARTDIPLLLAELAEAERHIERGNEETMKAYSRVRTLTAELAAIRESGVDPGLLRWCRWPSCWRSYNAATGPTDRGWIRCDGNTMLLCPFHAVAGHQITTRLQRDPLTLLASCECGETVDLGAAANLVASTTWWAEHVQRAETSGEPLSRRSLDAATLLWAADELGAQSEAHNQNLIDYTDHLRCFTEQPDRKSIVPKPGGDVDHG